MTEKVRVEGAPGFADFTAERLLSGFGPVDDRGELSVVKTVVGDLHVIPSEFVKPVESTAYADEWQAKTGRARSDIYIPEALR